MANGLVGTAFINVEAVTQGFQKVISKIENLSKRADALNNSRVAGAKRASVQLVKQESIARKAVQTSLDLAQKLRTVGASGRDIAVVTNNLRKLVNAMASGVLGEKDLIRSQTTFGVSVKKTNRQLRDFISLQKQQKAVSSGALKRFNAGAAPPKVASSSAKTVTFTPNETLVDKLTASMARNTAESQKNAAQLSKQALKLADIGNVAAVTQRKIALVGNNPALVKQFDTALRLVTASLNSGKLSAIGYNTALKKFDVAVKQTNRDIADMAIIQKRNIAVTNAARASFNTTSGATGNLGKTALGSQKRIQKFGVAMDNLQSASILAIGPLSRVGASISALGAVASRSTAKVAALFVGITVASVGLVSLVKNAASTSIEFRKVNKVLKAATGGAIAAKEAFSFVSDTSERLGLNLLTTAEGFAKLSASTKGTSLEGKKTREIFVNISAAAAAMNLDIQETGNVFRAFQQIISKGKVATEELSGQLGEVLPGAFQAFAKSLDVSAKQLTKLLQAGKVSPDQLVKFSEEIVRRVGGDVSAATDTFEASMNRLKTATQLFNLALDESGGFLDKFKGILNGTAKGIKFLTANMKTLTQIVVGLSSGLTALLFVAGAGFIKKIFDARAAKKAISGLVALNFQLGNLKRASLLASFSANKLALALKGLRGPLIFLAVTAVTVLIQKYNDFRNESDRAAKASRELTANLKEQTKATDGLSASQAQINTTALSDKIIEEQKALVKLRKTGQEILKTGMSSSTREFFGIDTNASRKELDSIAMQIAASQTKILGLRKVFKDTIEAKNLKIKLAADLDTTAVDGVVAKAETQIQELKNRITALNSRDPIKAVIALDLKIKNKEALDKFLSSLKVDGADVLSPDRIQELTRSFTDLTAQVDRGNIKVEKFKARMKALGRVGENATKNIEDGILGVIEGTQTMGEVFSNVIDNMLKDLTRFFFEAAIGGKGSGGGISDVVSGLVSFGASLFGGSGPEDFGASPTVRQSGAPIPGRKPARAKGGPVQRGKTFLVGENGPELFTPTKNGSIIPNSGTPSRGFLPTNGGSNTNVTVTVINNSSGTKAKTKESNNGSNRNIEVIIDDMVASKINNPVSRTNKALRNSLSQGVIKR